MSLSAQSLVSLVLGIAVGVFLGEYAAALEVIGTGFIQLLQMTVLPYVTVSMIVGLGELSYANAIQLGRRAGIVLLLLWGISLLLVLLLPLAFPASSSGTFFSSALVAPPPEFDFLQLYIPSNPFYALANNVVPAVVLFSAAVGVALIGIDEKTSFLATLRTFSAALTRVARFVVKLTPIGVFAIAASTAGTLSPAEFWRLQVFLVPYVAFSLLMAFWLLPGLIAAVTPLSYREITRISRDVLVTAFATASLFVVLPVLAERSKQLMKKIAPDQPEVVGTVDIVTPVSFSFPTSAKLLTLSFIPFAAWHSGVDLDARAYVTLMASGVVSAFGSLNVAVPFLLDLLRIPADMFDLYVATSVVNARFGTLLAASHTLAVALLGACAVHGQLRIQWAPVLRYVGISCLLIAVTLGSLRFGFDQTVSTSSRGAELLDRMSPAVEEGETIVHGLLRSDAAEAARSKKAGGLETMREAMRERAGGPAGEPAQAAAQAAPSAEDLGRPVLDRIRARGRIRVGYREFLPMAFEGESGKLLGLDVDLAQILARDLGVALELIPVPLGEIHAQLESGAIDIAMPGIPATLEAAESGLLSIAYLDLTLAFGVLDHRRAEFSSRDSVQALKGLRIGIVNIPYYVSMLSRYLPEAEMVEIRDPRSFFEMEAEEKGLDAMLFSAEALSAWSLQFPAYAVAVPHPDVIQVPIAFPVASGQEQMVSVLNAWIALKQKEGVLEQLYDHWVLGQSATETSPRWSVIRDVLGWVD